ncbi:MAG: hypothetical protein HOG45_03710 [Deltaproteobacteria bacterium]|jgi:hypothetical protein|nr:hypothetical protein [Deltaproteobacteria bacterium]
MELEDVNTEIEISANKFRMTPDKIHESLQTISHYCDSFVACEKPVEQDEMREVLRDSLRILLKNLEETV